MASSRLIELLDALLAAEAEFVVIGGLAAVLHGAPLGAVDLLCEIGEGQDYDWLLPRSELIGRDDRSMRIVSLPTLIELKRAANRPKDRLAIPILLATLDARTRDA